MLYANFYKDTSDLPHRINSSYSEDETIRLAEWTLNHPHFQWADSCEVTTDAGDVIAVVLRPS